MRSLLLAGAIGTLAPAYAVEQDALARIGAQIDQHPVVRAEFTQSKQMAAMKRPLVTAGRLVYSRLHGVLWQIEQPYRVSYVLGEEQIVEIGADGVRRERRLREVPGLAQLGRVFRAMFGAGTAALREDFNATVQEDAGKWEIDLKPRQPQLAQFLAGLHLSGGRFIDGIRIDEAGGDVTQIRFRDSHGASKPSAAELKFFGGDPSATPEKPARP